jgi:putative transposase
MDWARILAYITGTVDQELLLRNEYLAAENRILKAQLNSPLRLTDAERMTLAEIAHRLGRKALEDVANTAKPDTIMGWYRRLIARKFDGSKSRRYPGRPRIDDEIEQWVVRMAKEISDWGYDRIVGAMANLGYRLSDQTVGNILQRHGIPPAPDRKRTTTWTDFIRAHMSVLAGTDFLSVEVLTLRGLVNYFAMGHASRCFSFIRNWVEQKIRRHLAKSRQRRGFGWKRWSRRWLYDALGLFDNYRVRPRPKGVPAG